MVNQQGHNETRVGVETDRLADLISSAAVYEATTPVPGGPGGPGGHSVAGGGEGETGDDGLNGVADGSSLADTINAFNPDGQSILSWSFIHHNQIDAEFKAGGDTHAADFFQGGIMLHLDQP